MAILIQLCSYKDIIWIAKFLGGLLLTILVYHAYKRDCCAEMEIDFYFQL